MIQTSEACDASFDQVWGKLENCYKVPHNDLNHVPAWFAHFYMVNNTEFKSVGFVPNRFWIKSWLAALN